MLNKAQLIGYLGKDAEVRFTRGGTAVASFSVATTERWRDKQGQKQEKTEWHRIVLWGKPAETLKDYLVKGKLVYVEGRLQTSSWDDKQGTTRYKTEINAQTIQLLSKGEKRSSHEPRAESDDQAVDTSTGEVVDDGGELDESDIPFVWILPLIGILGSCLSV